MAYRCKIWREKWTLLCFVGLTLCLDIGQADDTNISPYPAIPAVGDANKSVTFTTKDGKTYANAKVSITDTGLSVLTSDGGGSVDFLQVPDDISVFSDSTQNQIRTWRSKNQKTPQPEHLNAGSGKEPTPAPLGVDSRNKTALEPPIGQTNSVVQTTLKDRIVAERRVGRSELGWGLKVSNDCKRVSWTATTAPGAGPHMVAVIDGIEGKEYGEVSDVFFSPDGRRTAYFNGDGAIVLDGNEGYRYSRAEHGSPVFSPDSKRLAYATFPSRESSHWTVVVDGSEMKQQSSYGHIFGESVVFSNDSKRIAFVAMPDNWKSVDEMAVVVVDGKEDKRYNQIAKRSLTFSPDNNRVAYVAGLGSKSLAVVDGKEGMPYDKIMEGSLVFSPDSKHFAYAARVDSRHWVVVVDGNENNAYKEIVKDSLVFSPDSKRLAYAARVGNQSMVVVDGKAGKPYTDIKDSSVRFSPDSSRLAYAAMNSGSEWVVVVDGIEQKAYKSISEDDLVFSPDSKRLAYAAADRFNKFVVTDESEGKPYDRIVKGTLVFSPDSKHLGYAAQTDGINSVVVVDGNEGNTYNQIVTSSGGKLIFDSPDSLRYVTLKGKDVYLVAETLKQ